MSHFDQYIYILSVKTCHDILIVFRFLKLTAFEKILEYIRPSFHSQFMNVGA